MLLGADQLGRSVFGELPELEDADTNPSTGGGSHHRINVPVGFHTQRKLEAVHATARGATVSTSTGVLGGWASGSIFTAGDREAFKLEPSHIPQVTIVSDDVAHVVTKKTDISCLTQLLEGKASVDHSERDRIIEDVLFLESL